MFVGTLSWRYAFSRSNRHRTASFVIMIGIAIGMMAIVTILALMNSLQFELLDQVKSIESFHLQVTLSLEEGQDGDWEAVVKKLSGIEHIQSVVPFIDTQVLVQDLSSKKSSTARLRAVPASLWSAGNPFSLDTFFITGKPASLDQIAVGYLLGSSLALRLDDTLSITVLREGQTATLAPYTISMETSGLFRTGLSEFDGSTLLGDVDQFAALLGSNRIVYGLYLDAESMDKASNVIQAITQIFPQSSSKTWQQLNNAFYSALMLEKALMYLFLFFMFVIIGVNIRNASARLLFVKKREIAILRAMGARRQITSSVFLLQAVMITALGEIVGIGAGLFISAHINRVFSWGNAVQFRFTGRNNPLLSYPFDTMVKGSEVFIVAATVLLLAVLFSFLGCRRLLQEEPMEMLYHE
jgi:lipoprotein-releasing system permease protein